MSQQLRRLQPATTLDEVFQTMSQQPLLEHGEFQAFYEPTVNTVRGGDKIARMRFQLEHRYSSAFYHAFLHGHQGVGKSTELTRLSEEVKGKFRTIRFSALKDLNPAGYKPFDVLLVMLIKLVEETYKHTGREPSASSLQHVLDWFAKKTKVYKQDVHTDVNASTGAGPKASSPLATLLGLFINVSGAIKYASDRETTITDYELTLIPELVRLVNDLLTECNLLLMETHQQEWLFYGEDFDKAVGNPGLAKDLFINHSAVFQDLLTHLIFNIPVELIYSEMGSRLSATGCVVEGILDTPVYNPDHTPFLIGRSVVRAVLERRLSSNLFEANQMNRVIVASGGNLRDLFACVVDAALNARLRLGSNGIIQAVDVDAAINTQRTEYLRHLGESIFDEQQTSQITYQDKVTRLLAIYRGDEEAKVSSPVLHSLLRARAVQEFNGSGWFGVHPLVVDILHRQGHELIDVEGKARGGTD